MSWITPADVAAVYPDADVAPGFIAHIQGLAEVCTGTQDEPIGNKLKSAFVEVVYRRSLAPDDNVQSETLGPYSQTRAVGAGQGITNRECRDLKKAVGKSTVGVLGVGAGPLETPPIHPDDGEIEEIFG